MTNRIHKIICATILLNLLNLLQKNPKNLCCVYSKEPSKSDSSFEHPKQMFKLKDEEKIAISLKNFA